MKSQRGLAGIVVIAAIALIGGGIFALKPSWFPGASRRAAQATQAEVSRTMAEKAKADAVEARSASAAAGVATIGRASSDLMASPATDFIRAEVPAVLAKLPAPDPYALLEAERRRVAFMEGKYEFAKQLYATESTRAQALEKAITEKEVALERAIQETRAANLEIEKAAAAQHAQTLQKLGFIALAVAGFALWAYAKFTRISTNSMGMIAAEIREGVHPITAIEKIVPVRLWGKVAKASRLATEQTDEIKSP